MAVTAMISLENLEPFLADLAGVQQDPVWHGEGDALAHTRLVTASMAEQPSFLALDGDDQQMLLAAGLLHDLGKARCTVWEDGRWTAPGHSAAGAKMARERLMTGLGLAGTPEALRLREVVCLLIRWHMRPLHIFERDDPARTLRQMASAGELTELFTLEKLAVLAEADIRGRICPDRARRLEDVALFRALAEEAGCLRGPFPYPDASSRWADMTGRAVVPGQKVYDTAWGTVVMVSGLPGTGKDTYIAARYGGMPMVSLDAVRKELGAAPDDGGGAVVRAAQEQARTLLRAKKPFVFNATNLSPANRGRWTDLFHRYGAAVRIEYLEAGWEERRRRNLSRRDSVPESVVARMLRSLEPPLLTEAEEVDWITVSPA